MSDDALTGQGNTGANGDGDQTTTPPADGEGNGTPPAEGGGDALTTPPADGTPPAGEGQGGEGDGDGDGEQTGAPEGGYADFTLPEGFETDPQMMETFTPVLQELDLDQGKAQQLVDAYTKVQQERNQAIDAQIQAQSDEWGEALKTTYTDKHDETIQFARKGVEALTMEQKDASGNVTYKPADPHLAARLRAAGLGNHPTLVSLFARVGKELSEGKLGPQGDPVITEQPAENILFPTMKS